MKYCSNCGREIADKAVVCPGCGVAVPKSPSANDAPSGGFAFLSFLMPIVGIILWALWRDTTPLRARSALRGTIVGVITGAVLVILYFALIFALVLFSLGV